MAGRLLVGQSGGPTAAINSSLLGVIEAYSRLFMASGWQNVMTACLVVLLLMFRPAGLFAFTASIGTGLGLFGLWRMTRRASVPKDEQGSWVVLPRTTPVAYDLDPWAEAQEPPPGDAAAGHQPDGE